MRRARKFRSGGGGRGSCRIRDGRGSGQETFSSGLQNLVCVTILRSVLAFRDGARCSYPSLLCATVPAAATTSIAGVANEDILAA